AARDCDDPHGGIEPSQLLNEPKSLFFGHQDVRDHEVGGSTLKDSNPFLAVTCFDDLEARRLERLSQHGSDLAIVINDEDLAHARYLLTRPCGGLHRARPEPCAPASRL